MALSITRTGARTFTFENDDPASNVSHGTYDHDADPRIVVHLRFLAVPTETWEQVDAQVTAVQNSG